MGDTGCWIQQFTAPTLVVACWIQQPTCILPSTCTGGRSPPVQLECKMHVGCWIQQVTTRVGAVTCWIQQPVSPKQVVEFSCLFNSEVGQLMSKCRVQVQVGNTETKLCLVSKKIRSIFVRELSGQFSPNKNATISARLIAILHFNSLA